MTSEPHQISVTTRHIFCYQGQQAYHNAYRTMEMENTPIFPDPPAITVERTLAIIKPDAVHRAEEVIEDIKNLGFSVLHVSTQLAITETCKLAVSQLSMSG